MSEKRRNMAEDDGTRADRVLDREDEQVTRNSGTSDSGTSDSGASRSGRRGSSRLSRSELTGNSGGNTGDDRADRARPQPQQHGNTGDAVHSDAGTTGPSTSTTAAAGAASSSSRADDERTNVTDTKFTRPDADTERTQAIDTERTQRVDTDRTGQQSGTTNQIRTDRNQDTERNRDAERNQDRGLYRDSAPAGREDAESTRVQPAPAASQDPELDRDAERERRRRDREQALGTRRKSDEVAETEPVRKQKRTTDKFFGALGLFLLRLVIAAIMGGHGLTKLADIGSVQSMLSQQPLVPMPEYAAWVLAICEVLIALAMISGLAVRFAGLGTAIIAILALSLVKFAGMQFFEGYTLKGELELLLAAVGIMFLFVGGGSWGFDGMIRRRRAASKS